MSETSFKHGDNGYDTGITENRQITKPLESSPHLESPTEPLLSDSVSATRVGGAVAVVCIPPRRRYVHAYVRGLSLNVTRVTNVVNTPSCSGVVYVTSEHTTLLTSGRAHSVCTCGRRVPCTTTPIGQVADRRVSAIAVAAADTLSGDGGESSARAHRERRDPFVRGLVP